MLFNSYIFLFGFLPALYLSYLLLLRLGGARAIPALILVFSIFFYTYHKLEYLVLIFFSILVNYALASYLARSKTREDPTRRKLTVAADVVFNLALLGYFKYSYFIVGEINYVTGSEFEFAAIALPLAISFYTFQQIGYVIDVSKDSKQHAALFNYILFVFFFPQLIAGPICNSRELIPQLPRLSRPGYLQSNFVVGITIISIGLFKKSVIADGIASYTDPIFLLAEQGAEIGFFDAWTAALGFTFQIYFDFSGYSDMAVGLARLFGIRLPINFFSPYKANSIIDFWRRWHITLSRFLRDRIYLPLGGNRTSNIRRYSNLLTVMVLGGIWHGAGWTFVLWGTLHGCYLIVNHLFRAIYKMGNRPIEIAAARGLTFFAVVFAWILFRAETVGGALELYAGMFGLNGVEVPLKLAIFLGLPPTGLPEYGISVAATSLRELTEVYLILLAVWLGIWSLPNTYELFDRKYFFNEYLERNSTSKLFLPISFQTTRLWGMFIALLFSAGVLAIISGEQEFIYFEF